MKRSPLKRKTELKPGPPLKRTRLKRVSAKKRKEKRETDGPRKEYRQRHKCYCGRRADHTHEIAAGSHRQNSVHEEFAWIAVCWRCHDWIQGIAFPFQYAIKRYQSPGCYRPEALNKLLRPNGTGFVDEEQVELAYQELLDKGVLR